MCFIMTAKARTASARDEQYGISSDLKSSKRSCHVEINHEVAKLAASTSKHGFDRNSSCPPTSDVKIQQESVPNDNSSRELSCDGWQDLSVAFPSMQKTLFERKVCAWASNQCLVEALLSPIDIPACESSTSTSGTDDDTDDVEKAEIANTKEELDSNDSDSTSDSCQSLCVHAGTSVTSTSANGAISNQSTLKNIDDTVEDDLINSQTAFDIPENFVLWPFREEHTQSNHTVDVSSLEESLLYSEGACLFLAMQQASCFDGKDKHGKDFGVADEIDDFDPYLFIKNFPDFSDVVSPYRPLLMPQQARQRQRITLVLDLDETLVHSTLEHCDDADFTFTVHLDSKEHTVYVRRRPYLQAFMEKVAQMFEIVIFTASQSVYAAQLLDRLDPTKKLIRHRVYRDSCVFIDGNYMKDLTILGRDLSKVVIIDNSPQAFRFQVDNGIPIDSWFEDRSDCALVSLLPFLESLEGVEDVRPIIAEKYNLRQKFSAYGMKCPPLEPIGSLFDE